MGSRKPSGENGFARVSVNDDGTASFELHKRELPAGKAEIEKFIVNQFAKQFEREGVPLFKVTQNAENHFDFTLHLVGGRVFLELVEIIYRDPPQQAAEMAKPGNPYGGRQIRVPTLQFAQQVRDIIAKKSTKYERPSGTPIHLLAYTTHWRFLPSEPVIRLVQHFLQTQPPIFETVFWLHSTDAERATLRVLFPAKPDPLEGRVPEDFAGAFSLTLDPANWKLVRRGGDSGEG